MVLQIACLASPVALGEAPCLGMDFLYWFVERHRAAAGLGIAVNRVLYVYCHGWVMSGRHAVLLGATLCIGVLYAVGEATVRVINI